MVAGYRIRNLFVPLLKFTFNLCASALCRFNLKLCRSIVCIILQRIGPHHFITMFGKNLHEMSN